MGNKSSIKAPGTDGLPVEFYRAIWGDIQEKLYELYSSCYKNGILNISARSGIISLLPKGNKDPKYLKNWRPVTLLNVDYKILAKVFATRLKVVLPSIIGYQQMGFMEGCHITDNIVKTMDVIVHANRKGKEKYVIMTIDFEKCFDHISYSAIFGALTYFEVGEEFQRWIRLSFADFRVCTQNKGYQSDYFVKGHSINQGCPISPYLYLVCGEILAHKLKENKDIWGITIGNLKLLLSQFGEDTVLYLNFDLKEINYVIDTLESIEYNTGLKISYEKTTLYHIGSLKNSNSRLFTKCELSWSDGDIELLGSCYTEWPAE